MSTTLAVHDLRVHYPGVARPTLSGVSFELPPGSFTVLVGASGSGKSTLLGCLAGLVVPSAGRVLLDGRPVTGPGPRTGMVFQRDVLFPWTTVAGNLAFALHAAGVPRRAHRDRVRSLLTTVGLDTEVAARRPYQLSGGMRQRVALARTLAGDPEALLMDEPFAALDAVTRLRMQDLVVDLWSRLGRTVVFVTHDVDEAVRLADTVLVVRDGGVHATLPNPLPRPRPAGGLADLPGYGPLRRTLHQYLTPDTSPEDTR